MESRRDMKSPGDRRHLKEIEEYDEPMEISSGGLILFTLGACLLAIPYFIMDLFDGVTEIFGTRGEV